jgi:hypothetical protein
MNRSKDLDTVAPDDPITETNHQEEIKPDSDIDISPKNPRKTLINPIQDGDIRQKAYDIFGHSKSPFSDFLVNPKVLTFAEQEKDEIIYLAVRPHWVTNLSWILITIFMIIVPLFFRYFSFLNFFPAQYRFSAILFWYLITFIYSFEKFLSWYFDFYLVTDKRIVDIDFNNLLNKHFAETDISMIQDMSSSVRGLLGTFFNFGDLLIQTASEINQISFDKVPNPDKIIKLLKELQESEKSKNEGGRHE